MKGRTEKHRGTKGGRLRFVTPSGGGVQLGTGGNARSGGWGAKGGNFNGAEGEGVERLISNVDLSTRGEEGNHLFVVGLARPVLL